MPRGLTAVKRPTGRMALAAWLLVLLVACLLVQPAYADGLAFSSSCPEDGATGVPTEGRLWVQYDHNIASVAENAKLASMTDASGKELPVSKCTVTLPDYETQFGLRQYFLFDVKGLDAGATYHMKVAAGVTAKNGSVCNEPVVITFTTAKEGEEPVALAAPAEKEGGTGDGTGSGSGNTSDGSSGVGDGTGGNSADDAAAPKGGIELVEWYIANSAGDEPRPTEMPSTMAHYAVLTFSKGIDYAPMGEGVDLSHLDANAQKVSLQASDGTRVEGATAYTLQSKSEERPGNMYVDLEGRLAPLSTYRIVVEPGLTTYSGDYASTERYEIEFRTNGDIGAGLTVAHVIAAAAAAFALAAGLAVQARRRSREKAGKHA